jgi:hypothetical protein
MLEGHRRDNKKVDNREGATAQNHTDGDKPKTDDSKDKWIRKIRLGTFEDTGNCKGYVPCTIVEHQRFYKPLVDGLLSTLQAPSMQPPCSSIPRTITWTDVSSWLSTPLLTLSEEVAVHDLPTEQRSQGNRSLTRDLHLLHRESKSGNKDSRRSTRQQRRTTKNPSALTMQSSAMRLLEPQAKARNTSRAQSLVLHLH